jgi:hypothetical protein
VTKGNVTRSELSSPIGKTICLIQSGVGGNLRRACRSCGQEYRQASSWANPTSRADVKNEETAGGMVARRIQPR